MANIKANGTLVRRLRQEMRISGASVSQMMLANLSSDRRALASFKGEEPPRWINEFGDRWLSTVETRLDDHFDEALLKSLAYILGTSFESITYTLYANPYKGLRAFGVEDAEYFGGREHEAREVFDRLSAHRLVGIIGASGSGKSSLAFAGVCPLIRNERPDWEVLPVRIGAKPLESLFYGLDQWLFKGADQRLDRPTRIRKFQENIRHGTDTLYYYLIGAHGDTDKTPVLIIDQWEELYTLCDSAEDRENFLKNLTTAVELDAARVLLTVRADFYDKLLTSPHPFFERLKPNLIDLRPMTPGQLQDAVEKPLKKTGLRFADGLVERLLSDVGMDQGQLPILQFALSELWANRDIDRNWVGFEVYENLGGIKKIIKTHADNVVDNILEPAEKKIAQITLPTLVNLGDQGKDIKLRAPLSQFGPEQQAVLRKLSEENCRLVTIFRAPSLENADEEVEYVEPVSEELIRSWPALRDWLNENLELHQQLGRLRATHQQYVAKGMNEDYLIQGGKPLEDARQLLEEYGSAYLGNLKPFIELSVKKRDAKISQDLRNARRRFLFATGAAVIAMVGFLSALSSNTKLEAQSVDLQTQKNLLDARNAELHQTIERLSTANELRFWFVSAEAVFERFSDECVWEFSLDREPIWEKVKAVSHEIVSKVRAFEVANNLESRTECGPLQRVKKSADIWSAQPERATNLANAETKRFMLAYELMFEHRDLINEMVTSQIIFKVQLADPDQFRDKLNELCHLSNFSNCLQ